MNKDIQYILQEKYRGDNSLSEFKDDVNRYNEGMPVAYIIGNIPFLNCKIDLRYKTLIPRTETEYWVEKVIEEMPIDFSGEVCDLFSGSGCVGVAIAQNIPKARITFIDNSENAIKQIQKNIKLNDIKNEVAVIKGDVFSEIAEGEVFDYIFANPPYISKDSNDVEESVLKYEPAGALFAGNNGMELVERTIKESRQFLKKGGSLIIEHNPEQTEKIKKIAKEQEYTKIQTNRDQYGKDRYTLLVD